LSFLNHPGVSIAILWHSLRNLFLKQTACGRSYKKTFKNIVIEETSKKLEKANGKKPLLYATWL